MCSQLTTIYMAHKCSCILDVIRPFYNRLQSTKQTGCIVRYFSLEGCVITTRYVHMPLEFEHTQTCVLSQYRHSTRKHRLEKGVLPIQCIIIFICHVFIEPESGKLGLINTSLMAMMMSLQAAAARKQYCWVPPFCLQLI